jgi:hypothetical protein
VDYEQAGEMRYREEAERKLLVAGLIQRPKWIRKMSNAFCDVVVLVRDTGMRNKKELFCARIEDIDWKSRVFLVRARSGSSGKTGLVLRSA